MSVLELLDTITGAHNNWVDGIRNDDPTFIGQITGDLHLVSVGMAAGTIFGKFGAYVLEGGTVGELATRISREDFCLQLQKASNISSQLRCANTGRVG